MQTFWRRARATSQTAPDATSHGSIDRRTWLKLMAASTALAGCDMRPQRHILPFGGKPPERRSEARVRYATSFDLDGLATGLVVDTHSGRPIKVEGNPEHPSSHGATLAIHQGALLQLYDPDRARTGLAHGRAAPTATVLRSLALRSGLKGLWIVTPPQSSPLARGLFTRIRERHPGTRIESYAPLARCAAYRGGELAFGRPLEIDVDLQRANVVVSFDADFLAAPETALRWSRAFASRRRLESPADAMNRLYVAEGALTPTGSLADHRRSLPTARVAALALAVAALLERHGVPVPGVPPALSRRALDSLDPRSLRWAQLAAADLGSNKGACAVLVGDGQPAAVHALAHLMHVALGAIDSTVRLWPAPVESPSRALSPRALAEAIDGGAVRHLVLLDVDPVFSAPAGLDLAATIARVPDSLHCALYRDDTARACRSFVPASHFMESWGDALAYDGTLSAVQPLIEPLYDSASPTEVLAALAGDPTPNGRWLLRRAWDKGPHGASGEHGFTAFLRRGFVEDSTGAPISSPPAPDPGLSSELTRALDLDPGPLQLQVVASNSVYDGRFANVAWLQELPQPVTSLTWGNAALLGADSARTLGVETGDIVELDASAHQSVRVPVVVAAGQPTGLVTLAAGYGQAALGRAALGAARGANVYRLWIDRDARSTPDVRLRRTGDRIDLAIVQQHVHEHARELAPQTTLAEYRRRPDFTEHLRGSLPTMHDDTERVDRGWSMTIDTGTCTGCRACMVACQAENNVPVVGPEGVRDNREMHWIRIDEYVTDARPGRGDPDEPSIVHQPMMCQHCDHAPCEYVCPVGATMHSYDGLNEMVYNRCVGTRFCSNNCPYKVRRFNWFEYNAHHDTSDLALSPDVTVRARGVMEKCTYCVQRIRRAEHEARVNHRPDIATGSVVTACQQACPTGAIQFARAHERGTAAIRWRAQARCYDALHELGTRPRTAYLAKIRNPSPGSDV